MPALSESPDAALPALSSEDRVDGAFRHAMRHVAASVIIVSAAQGGERFGMTATAFIPVSMAPPTILVAVNESASIHAPLHAAQHFCVNVLAASQADQSRVFSSRAAADERFTHPDWRATDEGTPYLRGAVANIFCQMLERRRVGTHTLFIAQVLDVGQAAGVRPLVYLDGAYLAV